MSLGILVLALDVWADLSFFSSGPHPGLALQAAAVVRNLLTAVAVACLFVDKKVSAYALLLAAILGMWRRLVYLAPLLAQGPGDSTVTATAGLDFGFRMLILGIALGWLFSKGQREGS